MASRTGKPVNALDRSLKALTIGAQQSAIRRSTGSQSEQAGEFQQQVQLPISGNATLAPMYGDTGLTWRMPFLWAPQQRLVEFTVPHFTYGIEFTEVPEALIVIHGSVIGWNKDVRNWVTGAKMRFIVWAEGASDKKAYPFAAVAHLTFQGYAAQPEDTGAGV